MISKHKLVIFSIFFFFALPSFCKEKHCKTFDLEIKQKAIQYKSKVNFYKAHLFFLEKNWDSTLVYSMKQLITEDNAEVNDFCHYLRGYSFMNKKLFKEAQKEFHKVSTSFSFYYKVKLYLGEICLRLAEHKNALNYFLEIEKLPRNEIYDFKRGVVYHNLGVCYLHLNNFDKAEEYLSKGFKVLQIEKDTVSLIGSYMNIANLYYEQYKDDLAVPYFEKAYQLSKKIKNVELKQNAVLNMAIVAENKKDLSAALAYRKEYENWKDSLNDQSKVWEIAELEKKFTVRQKQKEINVLEAENKLKIAERNGLFLTSVLLLILFSTGIYFYRQKIKNNKIILSQKIKLDELNATKDQLFSIVSHDLRSSVNALKTSNSKLLESLEHKNFSELDKLLHTNSAIVNGSYKLLDNLLHWALLQTKQLYFHKESLHLNSIIQQIELNYKPLMLEKNINFENLVSKEIFIYADINSLKIILRNLLDNAIKFSLENGKITIDATLSKDNFYNLTIEDSGSGMNKNTLDEIMCENSLLCKKGNSEKIGTGLGMQLCKSMIKKNDGKLLIESRENIGTKIIIQLQKT